jgi:hypothetical protein
MTDRRPGTITNDETLLSALLADRREFVENLAASDSGYNDDDLQRLTLIDGAIRAVETVIDEQRSGRGR